MVLGLKADAATAAGRKSRGQVYDAVREFVRRFAARNGSVCCKDLMGCDISTAEGMTFATEKGLFAAICPKMVRPAAEIPEEMLA